MPRRSMPVASCRVPGPGPSPSPGPRLAAGTVRQRRARRLSAVGGSRVGRHRPGRCGAPADSAVACAVTRAWSRMKTPVVREGGPRQGHRTWSGVPVRVRAGSQEVVLWAGSLFRSGCHGPGTGGLHRAVRGGPHTACLSGFPQVPLALVALPNTRFPQHPLGSPPISYHWLSVVFVLRVALSKTLSALPPSCLRGHHGGPQGFPGSLRPLAGGDGQSSDWQPPPCVRARPADGVAEGCGCSVQ